MALYLNQMVSRQPQTESRPTSALQTDNHVEIDSADVPNMVPVDLLPTKTLRNNVTVTNSTVGISFWGTQEEIQLIHNFQNFIQSEKELTLNVIKNRENYKTFFEIESEKCQLLQKNADKSKEELQRTNHRN